MKKRIFISLLLLFIMLITLSAHGWGGRGWDGDGWGRGGGGPFAFDSQYWWVGLVIRGVVTLLVFIGFIFLVKKLFQRHKNSTNKEAEMIVKKRFAQGEIDEESMNKMLSELRR